MPAQAYLEGEFSTAVIWYEFHCAGCNVIDRLRFNVARGDCVPRPGIPEKWRQIDGSFYCGRHELTRILFVDGKRV